MSWSAEQCRLLDALGYERFERGRPPAGGGEADTAVLASTPAAPPATPPAPRTAPSFPQRAAPPPAAVAPTARLLEALRRAANGADPAPLIDDLERLRREPALKRALWPKLRALRRSH